jgi:hypothetical protein
LSRRISLCIGVLIGVHAVPAPVWAQAESPPVRIDIVANDYAFMPLPPDISGGLTMFAFANQGKVIHEMSIGRLKAGATFEDLQKASKEGRPLRDFVGRSVGILVARAGMEADGRLLVDLVPGQAYFVMCNFKDTPDSPTHLSLGMFATFRPR